LLGVIDDDDDDDGGGGDEGVDVILLNIPRSSSSFVGVKYASPYSS
jgi:hypothetical protein